MSLRVRMLAMRRLLVSRVVHHQTGAQNHYALSFPPVEVVDGWEYAPGVIDAFKHAFSGPGLPHDFLTKPSYVVKASEDGMMGEVDLVFSAPDDFLLGLRAIVGNVRQRAVRPFDSRPISEDPNSVTVGSAATSIVLPLIGLRPTGDLPVVKLTMFSACQMR